MDSLDSGLSIAELKFELPVVSYDGFRSLQRNRGARGNDNHEEYGDPRNTGRRGLQGEVKRKSLLWPHTIGIRGATLLNYKKGLKRPTLAWNEMPFVTSFLPFHVHFSFFEAILHVFVIRLSLSPPATESNRGIPTKAVSQPK